jgi:hypothetical protein
VRRAKKCEGWIACQNHRGIRRHHLIPVKIHRLGIIPDKSPISASATNGGCDEFLIFNTVPKVFLGRPVFHNKSLVYCLRIRIWNIQLSASISYCIALSVNEYD